MSGLYFLFPTFLVILVSFLVVRAASIALMLTGMDEKRARFQAISAFTGTGYTTKETESVMNNPSRRKIILFLMIAGSAEMVTIIVTTTSSFVTTDTAYLTYNVLALIVGSYLIYRFATHKKIIRKWEGFIENRLITMQAFEEGPVEDLLHLIEGYGLVRIIVKKDSFWVGATLSKLKLTKKKLLVLGIERGKKWVPTPKATETIEKGDKMVIYGPLNILRTPEQWLHDSDAASKEK